jgi:hypothetical protein
MENEVKKKKSGYSPGVKFLALSAAALPFLIYINPGGKPIFLGYFPFIFLVLVILEKKYYPIRLTLMTLPIFMMIALFFVSIGKTEDLPAALVRMTHITIGFFAFYVVINVVRTGNDIDGVLKAIHSTGFLIAGLGIAFWVLINVFHNMTFLNLTYGGPLGPWLYGAHSSGEFEKYFELGSAFSLVKGSGRASAFLGDYAAIGLFALPVMNGMYSGMLILMDLVLGKSWNAKRYLVQCMLWINLLLTQSRTSWWSLAPALLMHWWWNHREEEEFVITRSKRRALKMSLSVFAIFGFLTAFIGIENMFLQIVSPVTAVMSQADDAGNTMGRLMEFYRFLDVISTHPLTGVGFDKSLGSKYAGVEWEFRTHNEYFNMAIFSGIFGLLAYISFLAIPFAYSFKLARLPSHPTLQQMGRLFKRLAVFWAISPLGAGRLDNPKDYLPYWVLTGLLMAAVIIAKSADGAASRSSSTGTFAVKAK